MKEVINGKISSTYKKSNIMNVFYNSNKQFIKKNSNLRANQTIQISHKKKV